MKITFLKDHLENKKGETKEVEDLAGKYFVLTYVAVQVNKEPYSESEEGTKGVVHKKSPQEADREIKKSNKGIK